MTGFLIGLFITSLVVNQDGETAIILLGIHSLNLKIAFSAFQSLNQT